MRRWEINAWNSMLEISGLTGGQAFGNIYGFSDALSRAAADSRLTYSIDYYPSHDKWDGSFREIKITVNRPGLRTRHRKGYVALAGRAESAEERRMSLEEAVWSPLDATGIPIDVRITPESRPNTLQFTLLVDPAAVSITERDGLRLCALDVLYVQQSRDHHNLNAVGDEITLKLTPDRYRQLMQQGIGLKKEVEIVPGAERLRVVIRDVQSAAVGSVTVPIAPR